jgi:hypothetical protein
MANFLSAVAVDRCTRLPEASVKQAVKFFVPGRLRMDAME